MPNLTSAIRADRSVVPAVVGEFRPGPAAHITLDAVAPEAPEKAVLAQTGLAGVPPATDCAPEGEGNQISYRHRFLLTKRT